MRCPYCVSEIDDRALVCSVCRRDLYLLKPLLDQVADLEARLAVLQGQLQPEISPELRLEQQFAIAEAREDVEKRSLKAALGWWAAPLALLISAHWMLFFVYDASKIYLSIFALIVPLPFGYLFARALRRHIAWELLAAFLMAGLAVFGMAGVTTLIDDVPLLPQNLMETREFIEFAASIGFSFVTGLWLCHWQMRHDERKRLAGLQAGLRERGAVDGQKLAERLSRLNDIGSGAVALLTTAFALYTGLKKLIG